MSSYPPCVCLGGRHGSLEGTWQPFHHLYLQAFLPLWMFFPVSGMSGLQSMAVCFQIFLWLPCPPLKLLHTQLELEDRIANGKPRSSFLISPERQWAWSHGPAQWAWEHHLGPGRRCPLLAGSGWCFSLEEWDRRVQRGEKEICEWCRRARKDIAEGSVQTKKRDRNEGKCPLSHTNSCAATSHVPDAHSKNPNQTFAIHRDHKKIINTETGESLPEYIQCNDSYRISFHSGKTSGSGSRQREWDVCNTTHPNWPCSDLCIPNSAESLLPETRFGMREIAPKTPCLAKVCHTPLGKHLSSGLVQTWRIYWGAVIMLFCSGTQRPLFWPTKIRHCLHRHLPEDLGNVCVIF